MTINEYLPMVMASKFTYYNLDSKSVNDYKKLYAYLKKHRDKTILPHMIDFEIMNIKTNFNTDYLVKYKIMQLISRNII